MVGVWERVVKNKHRRRGIANNEMQRPTIPSLFSEKEKKTVCLRSYSASDCEEILIFNFPVKQMQNN